MYICSYWYHIVVNKEQYRNAQNKAHSNRNSWLKIWFCSQHKLDLYGYKYTKVFLSPVCSSDLCRNGAM